MAMSHTQVLGNLSVRFSAHGSLRRWRSGVPDGHCRRHPLSSRNPRYSPGNFRFPIRYRESTVPSYLNPTGAVIVQSAPVPCPGKQWEERKREAERDGPLYPIATTIVASQPRRTPKTGGYDACECVCLGRACGWACTQRAAAARGSSCFSFGSGWASSSGVRTCVCVSACVSALVSGVGELD